MEKPNIKILLLDVDGTLTDGGIYISEKGDELKKFNAKDGIGIKRVMRAGIHVGFISASISQHVVRHRAKMLGVPFCYVGDVDKITILKKWLDDLNLDFSEAAFIGDDVNDKDVMEQVGFSACPANAVRAIRETVDVVLELPGGAGCVREFIDTYL